MEKSILIAKSILQTIFFGFKMNKNWAALLSLIVCLPLFVNLIFNDNMSVGLNYLIMSLLSILFAILIHQPSINNRLFWWAALAAVTSGIGIAIKEDDLSLPIYFLSHFILIGSLHGKNIQNIFIALAQWVVIAITQLFSFLYFLLNAENWSNLSSAKKYKHVLRLISIPMIIGVIFISLYSQASESFSRLAIQPLLDFLHFLTSDLSGEHIFKSIVAAFFLIPLLIPFQIKPLTFSLKKVNNFMIRVPNRSSKLTKIPIPTLALKNELRIAELSLYALNGLVVIFNLLDVKSVWLSRADFTAAELSEFVHNGTNLTILSILLGTLILATFFRGNLNFIKGNERLRLLANIWIGQNVFLVCSTFMRNYHYVSSYGLTEKRMGVVVFLVITLLGLIFTFQKIRYTHHLRYLADRFSLGLFLTLLAYSTIDHPAVIMHYSAEYQHAPLDMNYLANIAYQRPALMSKYVDQLNEKSKTRQIVTSDAGRYFKPYDRKWYLNSWVNYRNYHTPHHYHLNHPDPISTTPPVIDVPVMLPAAEVMNESPSSADPIIDHSTSSKRIIDEPDPEGGS